MSGSSCTSIRPPLCRQGVLGPEVDAEAVGNFVGQGFQSDNAGLLHAGTERTSQTVMTAAARLDGVPGGQAGAGRQIERFGDCLPFVCGCVA
jgi:hypothetical protein